MGARKVTNGTVVQRCYRDRDGNLKTTGVWYARYYVNGKRFRVATGTEDRDEAIAFLHKKLAESESLRDVSDMPERVKMGQLFDMLLDWYGMKERRTVYDVKRKIEKKNGLRAWFGRMKVQAVTTSVITGYVAWRRKQKPRPANGTINRELAYVRRAMKLGAEHEPPLVLHIPKFEMLKEADPRGGTFTHARYRALRGLLPAYARLALVIGYHTGARKGEVLKIQRSDVDLNNKRIELRGSTTKNKRPRFLPIYGDMTAEIEMALSAGVPGCSFLIHRDGERVYDFEKAWATACDAAGFPDALFHDLRRTALTNMVEAGYSEKEAMEVSGHKTRAVFDRYHIVSAKRLKELTVKLEEHLKKQDDAAKQAEAAEVIN